MSFFEQPILNSPYKIPEQHWELDDDGRPTDIVIEKRRRSDLISAMPKPRSAKGIKQSEMELSSAGLEGQDMAYIVTEFVNDLHTRPPRHPHNAIGNAVEVLSALQRRSS